MNPSTPQQLDRLIAEPPKEPIAQEQPASPFWHKPTITRIDIKRTMIHTGSTADMGATTPNN